MALSQDTIDALKSHLKERKVPRGLRSKLFGDVLGIEGQKEQGKFKFSETKAGKERASGAAKNTASRAMELRKAMESQEGTEEYIKKGGQ